MPAPSQIPSVPNGSTLSSLSNALDFPPCPNVLVTSLPNGTVSASSPQNPMAQAPVSRINVGRSKESQRRTVPRHTVSQPSAPPPIASRPLASRPLAPRPLAPPSLPQFKAPPPSSRSSKSSRRKSVKPQVVMEPLSLSFLQRGPLQQPTPNIPTLSPTFHTPTTSSLPWASTFLPDPISLEPVHCPVSSTESPPPQSSFLTSHVMPSQPQPGATSSQTTCIPVDSPVTRPHGQPRSTTQNTVVELFVNGASSERPLKRKRGNQYDSSLCSPASASSSISSSITVDTQITSQHPNSTHTTTAASSTIDNQHAGKLYVPPTTAATPSDGLEWSTTTSESPLLNRLLTLQRDLKVIISEASSSGIIGSQILSAKTLVNVVNNEGRNAEIDASEWFYKLLTQLLGQLISSSF
uniref:Uncharacterized protein n=1 Tax=Psilocybe cubensis TaxID=181762 RepID=A0A8H7YBA4_PSICU